MPKEFRWLMDQDWQGAAACCGALMVWVDYLPQIAA